MRESKVEFDLTFHVGAKRAQQNDQGSTQAHAEPLDRSISLGLSLKEDRAYQGE